MGRKRQRGEGEEAKPRKKLPAPKAAPNGAPAETPVAESEATSDSSSSEDEEDSDEEEAANKMLDTALSVGNTAVPPVRLQLYKLGHLCCSAIASYVDGNTSPGPLGG